MATAFNGAHWGTIDPGAVIMVSYGWNNGGYGALWSQASPENSNAKLISTNHSMEMDASGSMWYGFDLANTGSNSTSYDLDGGSVGG